MFRGAARLPLRAVAAEIFAKRYGGFPIRPDMAELGHLPEMMPDFPCFAYKCKMSFCGIPFHCRFPLECPFLPLSYAAAGQVMMNVHKETNNAAGRREQPC
jgi:hypothetical protein